MNLALKLKEILDGLAQQSEERWPHLFGQLLPVHQWCLAMWQSNACLINLGPFLPPLR